MTQNPRSTLSRHVANAGTALALLAFSGAGLSGCSPTGMAVSGGATAVTAAQKEKGLSRVISDTQIRIEINHLWIQASETIFLEVDLQVDEGRVLLTGTVPQPEDRLQAVRLAWQAAGVGEVINEIQIDDTDTVADFARDGWITAQIEAKLLFDGAVLSINYSVETVNQTVYLMGIAQHQAELDRAVGHAKDVDYVRRVISYLRLKDDPARAS